MILFLAGCAAAVSESFKVGQELSQAQRWDDAIVYLEKAVADVPGNKDYHDALLKARQQAAKIRYEKAKQTLAAASIDPDMPALQQAFKEGEAAANLDPNNQDILSFNNNAREKITALENTIKSLYGQVDVDMQKEDWGAAIQKLKEINKLYPGYEDTGIKLAKAEREGARIYYQQGIQLGRQEDWKMATQAFKAAMDINPAYYDVANLYKEAISKDRADYFIGEAEKALQAKKLERAMRMYEKGIDYEPGNRTLAKKLGDLKANAGQTHFEEAYKFLKQGQLSKALKNMDLVKNYTPAMENDPAYKDFHKNLTAKLMERADKYMEQQLWGNALVWYQRAESNDPSYPELFQKLIDTKDQINKRIKKSIAVFDFSSPKQNEDAGRIVANKLIAYLHKNASGDIRIIERENLQSILREMQLGQTGIVDTKTVQTLGKMRGIDTFIMGNVLHFSTMKGDTPSTNQVKVLVDEESIRNPDFSDWLIMNPKPTAEDLKNAPPRNITRKNYQFVSYKQGSARITAMIEISYKLVDTLTGENIFTNTVPGRLIKEDRYSDAVPAANIVYDPLDLPTEAEVLDELTNEKISEVAQSVLKNFQSLEVAYYNEGQQLQKRRNIDKAIEKYVDAVYDEKLKGISTPISQKSLEIIEDLLQDK
jgi:tetratricopeptide (TPR) repeat protein